MKKKILDFWDHEPTWGELLEDIFENYTNITCEFGGQTSFWMVIRDPSRTAIVPVQTGKDIDEVAQKVWLFLETKLPPQEETNT